jgi:glyoxylase I family protein
MKLLGIHHVKFTVSSIEKSQAFYQEILGFRVVAEYPDFTMLFNGTLYIGLTTHKKDHKKLFEETNVGLDHVSFVVHSHEDLVHAKKLFIEKSVPHGEIKKLSNNIYVLDFRDPDKIQLELCCKS